MEDLYFADQHQLRLNPPIKRLAIKERPLDFNDQVAFLRHYTPKEEGTNETFQNPMEAMLVLFPGIAHPGKSADACFCGSGRIL